MSGFGNMFRIPELRRRILFTLGMIAVYRVGIFVTTPGVNRAAMKDVVEQGGGFLGMFNVFTGGALEQLSIFALNIMPYVTASIIFSLLTVVVKPLEELRKEGEAGQRKINQYTRYATVALSLVQSIGIAFWLESLNDSQPADVVVGGGGWGFRIMTCISLTTGTAFLMWLGEQITERGIGNGISLIIFAGIVASLPAALVEVFGLVKADQLQPVTLLVVAGIAVGIIAVIAFFERAQRRLPIHYAKRVVGRKQYGGQSSHLPLRVNMSGVIPPIFATSLMFFPMTFRSWLGDESFIGGLADDLNRNLQPGNWIYTTVFAGMIIFFCFFYTAVTFQPVEVAENLKKQNAFIPGVRPGKNTAEYIDRVVTRITFGGALYVAAVCTVPDLLRAGVHMTSFLGGTSLMILVGVALDTVQQIESHLITRHYEGLTGPRTRRLRARGAAE